MQERRIRWKGTPLRDAAKIRAWAAYLVNRRIRAVGGPLRKSGFRW
jgi:hypothetical protein